MPRIVEKKIFTKCYKKGFHFYIYETYTEIDGTDMAELSTTICPAIARGQGYDQYRCNGLTEYGIQCLHSHGKHDKPVQFPKT